MSFNEKFDQHGAWRREFALRLRLLAEWMKDHELLDAAVEERLQRLESQVRSDKVMVAFVAEFSRGKSELINAIFFAGYHVLRDANKVVKAARLANNLGIFVEVVEHQIV